MCDFLDGALYLMNYQQNSRSRSLDPFWRKSRIAARIWLRRQSGKLTDRDYVLAPWLASDPGVTERLIDQALASITACKLSRSQTLQTVAETGSSRQSHRVPTTNRAGWL
jgi:hypothetical protein